MGVRTLITSWPVSRQLTGAERAGRLGAGVASTKDPRYLVAPQRERLLAADAR